MTRIGGLVVPWDVGGDLTVGGRSVPLRFSRGSIEVPADASRVKLLIDHDRSLVAGYGVEFTETDDGLVGVFDVSGPGGDVVVAEVAGRLMDGLSPGFDLTTATRARVRRTDGTAPAKGEALLREVSLVSVPAFVNARAEVLS